MSYVKLDIGKMKVLVSFLEGGMPDVKVGVISKNNKRQKGKPTNAEVGFANEFGVHTGKTKIPARSFIRMPLETHFYKNLLSKKSLTKKEFEKAVKNGKADEFAKKVGVVAEETIQDAFATRGWGKWKENKPSTIKRKKSDSPLIDTGELRRSISSEVIK